MKNRLLLLALLALPFSVSASEVRIDLGNVRVQAPGVTVTFGSRNDRGDYWDGREWRDKDYWRRHEGHRGEKYYTGHGKGHHCPPGQAKKGNC